MSFSLHFGSLEIKKSEYNVYKSRNTAYKLTAEILPTLEGYTPKQYPLIQPDYMVN